MEVVPIETNNFNVIDFGVALPSSILHESQVSMSPNIGIGDSGIVGVITLFNKSVLIWFGWGRVYTTAPSQAEPDRRGAAGGTSLVFHSGHQL